MLEVASLRLVPAATCIAALALGGCGSKGDDAPASAAPTTKGPVAITYKDILIAPESVTVRVGQQITWTNVDGTPHNVISTSGPATIKSPDFRKGQSFSFTPDKTGVIKYVCTFHPSSMVGSITVVA